MSEETNTRLLGELKIIQGVICRLSYATLLTKTMSLAALLCTGFTANKYYLMMMPVLLICLWWIDAFYLSVERQYRLLYEWVAEHRETTKDRVFYSYSLKPRVIGHCPSVFRIMFTKVALVYHGTVVTLAVLLVCADQLLT